MKLSAEMLRRAAENCNSDPIHIPGKIQSFGVLIATDPEFETIKCISENASDLFNVEAASLIGQPTSTLFGREELHSVRNALSHETITKQREVVPFSDVAGHNCQVSVHAVADRVILEIIKENAPTHGASHAFNQVQMFLTSASESFDLNTFFDEATQRLRAMTGYDRVKFYRFLPDESGEVIAEARHPKTESFLGLRFPESDIPRIARQLYAKTPIRVIYDVMGADSPLIGTAGDDPLDMSLALLRGKDQVHRQYLENMGLAGTLTVPVVVDGALWGLFAAHNMQRAQVRANTLVEAELIGKLISLRVQHALETRRNKNRNTCLTLANRLLGHEDSELAARQYWERARDEVYSLMTCDGLVISRGRQTLAFGNTPDEQTCKDILNLGNSAPDDVFVTSNLPKDLPDSALGNTAGALVLTVAGEQSGTLAFLRDRVETQVKWAGAPQKQAEMVDSVPRLNPRNSFATYMENVSGRSADWSGEDLEMGKAFQAALTRVFLQKNEAQDNRHRLGLLVQELNHRVRNILALVQSLAAHTRENSKTVEAYSTALEKRIIALAGAHNLLTRSDMKGAVLSELIMLELQPFTGDHYQVNVTGSTLALRPDAAAVMALLFHELTSNAVKYGSLSQPGGQVDVSWEVTQSGIDLSWRERNGPVVQEPEHAGFGRSILEEILAYEFKGSAKLAFEPEGLKAQFQIPGEVIVDAQLARPIDEEATKRPPAKAPSADYSAKQALVVEDNFVVAMMAKRLIRDMGFERVDTAASLSEAEAYMAENEYDFTLLDVNLQGEVSVPLAQRLLQLDLPFAFASGYGSDGHEAVLAFDVPNITKPIDEQRLRETIADLLKDS